MAYKTVVAIGRQYGSGGRQIGEALASLMGVPFFDRELIKLAAEKSGISPDAFAHIDETATNSLLYALSTGSHLLSGHFSSISDLPMNDKLYILQNNIIRDIVKENESCVIVGRCADFILRDEPNCMSVFIHAPFETRAKRVMEGNDISMSAAETRTQKNDKKRASYYRFYTNREWGNVKNYEISVNSSVLGIPGTAKLLLEFIKAREARS